MASLKQVALTVATTARDSCCGHAPSRTVGAVTTAARGLDVALAAT